MRPSAPALAPALRPSQLARGVHSQCTLSLHRSWSLPVTCSRTVDARMSASSSCSSSHSPNKTFSSGQTKGSLLGRRRRTVLAGCRPFDVSPERRRGISYAVGTQREEVESALKKLLRRKGDGPGQPAWRLTAAEDGLQRTFRFKTFGKTWDFMNAVAAECKKQKHHPEWSNVYSTTIIRWTTHNPPGLSAKDITMATFCDEQAAKFGELPAGREDEVSSNDDMAKQNQDQSILDKAAEEGSCGCGTGEKTL